MKEKALCFDDVLLVPRHFKGTSRKEIDISTEIAGIRLTVPLISANMPSTFSPKLAFELGVMGGMAIMDRMRPLKDQLKDLKEYEEMCSVYENRPVIGASVGIGGSALADAKALIDAGASLICVDVAHANQANLYKFYNTFRSLAPKFPLMIGNFATHDFRLDQICNDPYTVLKIGVGSGHVCTTRIETGCGLPTFESLKQFLEKESAGDRINLRAAKPFSLIADGGHKSGGDCVKSLAMGARAVMIGSLFAGTDETSGAVIEHKGSKYKVYRGNASAGTKNASEFVEGAETLVPLRGPISQIVKRLCDGIRSGMSYCGAMNLSELRQNAIFQEITSAGHHESKPHGAL